MKHHKTRGESNRGRPKEKPVKKRKSTRCADKCASATFTVKHDKKPGVLRICNKCGDVTRLMNNSDKVIQTPPGIGNSHRDKEKSSAYQKAYKEKKVDTKINRLITDVFGV